MKPVARKNPIPHRRDPFGPEFMAKARRTTTRKSLHLAPTGPSIDSYSEANGPPRRGYIAEDGFVVPALPEDSAAKNRRKKPPKKTQKQLEREALAEKRKELRQIQKTSDVWVKNLMQCRKVSKQQAVNEPGHESLKAWVSEQHRRYKSATIPVLHKCLIAATGISKLFNQCQDEFKKPEYRPLYWHWATKYVELIDYRNEHGNLKITEKSPPEYRHLLEFIQTCKAKKSSGFLTDERVNLLTSIGIKWDPIPKEVFDSEEEESSSDESDNDTSEDETWELPTSKSKRYPTRASKRNATRRVATRSSSRMATRNNSRPSRNDGNGSSSSLPPFRPTMPSANALQAWARRIMKLREYYTDDDSDNEEKYDIPWEELSEKIWMNKEVSRCTAGAVIESCRGVLLAMEMADDEQVGELSEDAKIWGEGLVALIDYVKRNGRLYTDLTEFLCSNRKLLMDGVLSTDRAALLKGVYPTWAESAAMRYSQEMKKKKDLQRRKRSREELISPKREVIDVDALESDEEQVVRKRAKSEKFASEMVSGMINAQLAKSAGKSITEDQSRAVEYMSRHGAEALDAYAAAWFERAGVVHKTTN